jgi:ADP-heptose:LPS heptosyltransferase
MYRTIKTCPGIGDCLWVIQKLIGAGEKFDWQIHNGFPQRGRQVFDLLPQISNSCEYVPNLPYRLIDHHNIVRRYRYWHLIRQHDFYLSANRHLEEGKRIEEFLPDLPTSFRLEYTTGPMDGFTAASILNRGDLVGDTKSRFIGIYGSAYSTQRAWGFWDAEGWYKFIDLMRQENPELAFVIIGASFDTDLGNDLIARLEAGKVPHINTIGQPLSVVIEILKRLDYFVGFPSGLSILNETLGAKGTFMFYPPHLQAMMNAWADPARIESGQYKGAQFCEPEKALGWIRDEYCLFEKL